MHKVVGVLLNKFIQRLILFLFLMQHGTVEAQSLRTLWQSELIPDEIVSVVVGELDRDWGIDLVYISRHALVVTNLAGGRVTERSRLKIPQHTELHRISSGDFDRDGQIDLIVNANIKDRFESRLYHVLNGKLELKHTFENLVMPLSLGHEVNLYVQRYLGQGRWSPEMRHLNFQNSSWSEGAVTILKKGVGHNQLSLFDVAADGALLAQIRGDSRLEVRALNGERKWLSGLTYGGAVDYYRIQSRDPLGLNSESIQVVAPRMQWQGSSLWLAKNDSYLGAVVGSVPNVKSARLVLLDGTNDGGFTEAFTSTTFNGAIADVQLLDFDEDSEREILIVTQDHQSGFLDGYSSQKSRLSIVDFIR